jgi:hypothetical protein
MPKEKTEISAAVNGRSSRMSPGDHAIVVSAMNAAGPSDQLKFEGEASKVVEKDLALPPEFLQSLGERLPLPLGHLPDLERQQRASESRKLLVEDTEDGNSESSSQQLVETRYSRAEPISMVRHHAVQESAPLG